MCSAELLGETAWLLGETTGCGGGSKGAMGRCAGMQDLEYELEMHDAQMEVSGKHNYTGWGHQRVLRTS